MTRNITPLKEGTKICSLTVIKLAYIKTFHYSKRNVNKEFYLCKCDCGRESIVYRHNLTRKVNTTLHCKHCCHAKHNLRNTRLFGIWAGMRNRIYNKNSIDYKNYGNRGITICKEWNEFLPFYKWAINNGYRDNLTIDRIDNNGNYEPSNCRWATRKEQNKNKRNIKKIFYKNKEQVISDLSKKLGIKHSTLYMRLRRKGICKDIFSNTNLKTGELLK